LDRTAAARDDSDVAIDCRCSNVAASHSESNARLPDLSHAIALYTGCTHKD